MSFNDTGLCVPETHATLLLQQRQLRLGKRNVQMFPIGTAELPLPEGMSRYENSRGVFHYAPDRISRVEIAVLSACGRENEFLNLGPVSKPEIAERVLAGENLLCVTEYTPDGIEVRSAAGTDKTIDAQREYFERTKEPNSIITIGGLLPVLEERRTEVN
jgi:hypothetical protein